MSLPRTYANFNGTNGDDLVTDYPSFTYSVGTFKINSNAAYPASASSESMAYVSGETFTADHYAQGVIDLASSRYKGVGVRITGSGNGYAYYGQGTTYGTRKLIRNAGGSPTELASAASQFATGDTAYLEAVGTALTAKRNGSTDLTATDSTYSTGSAGLTGRDLDFAATARMRSLVVDNIGGGGGATFFSRYYYDMIGRNNV